MGILNFEVLHQETDHICVRGRSFRSPTVLIRVLRGPPISRRVLVVGGMLVLCHLLDGFMTFWGVGNLGMVSEANHAVRFLIASHGTIPALFMVKSVGVLVTLLLMWLSHSRRWLRPLLSISVIFYVTVALVPWAALMLRGY